MNQIRVGAVRYLNTKPLLWGVHHHPVLQQIALTEDYPAKIAQQLIDDQIDVGLIPVAAIPKLSQSHIITDYCIGAEGPVASVCIFSEVPMAQMEAVYLDYQSRTSVALARILLKEYWQQSVHFMDASGEDYRSKISGTTAGVVIGDRALEQRLQSQYIYDLAEAWKAHTGLPFVFAAWVANKELPQDFVNDFNAANALGLAHIDDVVIEYPYNLYNLETYYRQNISYELTTAKRRGLNLFLSKL